MSPYRKYSRLDPRYHWTRAHHDLGRRGTVLLCLGIIAICLGVSVITDVGSKAYPLLAGPRWWDVLCGTLWIIAGGIAVVCSRRRQGDDWPGWAAIYVVVAYRIVAYAHGWVLWLTDVALDACNRVPGLRGLPDPDWQQGSSGGLIGVCAWGGALVTVLVCSGWPESTDHAEPAEPADHKGAP